jgi:GNAT superfamily N-acetyltransferase
MLTRELREFAQTPDRYTRVSADVERYADERVCVIQGNTWAGVAGVRVGEDDVAALVDEVRERIPPGKTIVWWIDPDAQPTDLRTRLVSLGFRVPADRGDVLYALACVEEPPPGPPEVRVARVETFEDHVAATELVWDAFATPTERREAQRVHLRAEFDAAAAAGVPVTFLARIDGAAVGVGRSIYSDRGVFLVAGAVVEHARGRGVYRALVRARWDDAVARGTPALVTEALPDTSYPILKRVGFVEVCEIRRLEDPTRV